MEEDVLLEEFSSLTTIISAIEEEKAELRYEVQRQKKLLMEMEEKYNRKENDRKALLGIVENLRSVIQVNESKDERVKQLETEIAKLQERCDEMHLHAESIRAELMNEMHTKLQTQQEKHETQLSLKEAEIGRLNARCVELRTKVDASEKRLRDELARASEDTMLKNASVNEFLRHKIDETRARLDDKLSQLTAEKERATAEAAELRERVRTLEKENEAFRKGGACPSVTPSSASVSKASCASSRQKTNPNERTTGAIGADPIDSFQTDWIHPTPMNQGGPTSSFTRPVHGTGVSRAPGAPTTGPKPFKMPNTHWLETTRTSSIVPESPPRKTMLRDVRSASANELARSEDGDVSIEVVIDEDEPPCAPPDDAQLQSAVRHSSREKRKTGKPDFEQKSTSCFVTSTPNASGNVAKRTRVPLYDIDSLFDEL